MENKQERNDNVPTIGSSTQAVGGVDGMSPAERVQYIQQIQKISPLARIVESVKKLKLSDLGLAKSFFDAGTEAFRSVKTRYEQLRNKQNINQPISGLTENVSGVERLKHEIDPGANVDLIDGLEVDKKKGLYVDLDWTPHKKGSVE
jgi:hypothetical protein